MSPRDPTPLHGKVAIVTGAADGMGRAIALKFAQDGADCFVVDVNNVGLAETARLVEAEGRKAVSLVADLANRPALQGVLPKALETFPQIDILVNNAGVSRPAPINEYPLEYLNAIMDVNLKAPFLLSLYVARHWAEHDIAGRIISITSINAEVAQAGSAAYSASKGALRQATKAIAYDLGPYGITVNAVGPGYTRTGMTKPIFDKDGGREKEWAMKTPLGRIGEAEDIANAVAFLASDEASYITGQTIYVEGGRTIWS